MSNLTGDYSNKKEIRKIKIKIQIGLTIPILLLLSVSIFLISAPFIGISIREEAKGLEILVFLGAIYFIFLSIWALLKISGLSYVKFYSYGLSPPWKPIKNILRREEYIIPFSKIKSIYPNTHKDIDYITLEFKEAYDVDYMKINKKWIYDLDEFIDICSKRVNIEEDSLYVKDMIEYYTSRKGKKELDEMVK